MTTELAAAHRLVGERLNSSNGLPEDAREIGPGYHVTADGRVFSTKTGQAHLLRPRLRNRGYLSVVVVMNGRRCDQQVHRLVLLAFRGPAPHGHEGRHLNGDPSDNRLSNLAWGTHLENMRDAKRHGTVRRGTENGANRFTEAEVLDIRSRYDRGEEPKFIARHHRMSVRQIVMVGKRQSWAWLPDPNHSASVRSTKLGLRHASDMLADRGRA